MLEICSATSSSASLKELIEEELCVMGQRVTPVESDHTTAR